LAGRIWSIEKSNDLIGIRTRDLPTCSILFYLVYEAVGTVATPGPIVPASGDSEHDRGEADGM
jgi:hypothetical protein